MIDEPMAAFIEGPVMIILSVADRMGRPTIARGVGARFEAQAGAIVVLVSRRQWPGLTGAIAPGGQVAVTFCRAADYTTYQIKGRVCLVEDADAEALDLAARYVRITGETLGGLGVGQALIDQWVHPEDVVRLAFAPTAVFVQTPGPGAGQALEASA
jgi:hypothetical protein